MSRKKYVALFENKATYPDVLCPHCKGLGCFMIQDLKSPGWQHAKHTVVDCEHCAAVGIAPIPAAELGMWEFE